jgi:hypothetical protein
MESRANTKAAVALDLKAIQGVDKYFANIPQVMIAGATLTPTALKALFQAEIDVIKSVDQARSMLKEELAQAKIVRAKAETTRRQLRAFVLANYGAAAVSMLNDFDIPVPGSKGKPTAQTKAEAVVKRDATRKARHTLGSKAKKAIKGQPSTPTTPKA